MFVTTDKKEQEVLESAGVGLVGIKQGKLIRGASQAEKYEMILTFDCSEEEASNLLGKKEVIEEVGCIGYTKSGDPCKRPAVKGSKFCAAHKE